jgi:[ribosomal protein S5]-alanine N-acetyltransferase
VRLQTDKCLLRAWTFDDAAGLAAGLNNRRVWLHLRDWVPHPYSIEDARNYLERVIPPQSEHAVCIEVDGAVGGGMSIRMGSGVHRRTAELGYWLAEPLWSRGIMTSAVRAFVPASMQSLGLDRIFATTYSNNPASARVLENAGFVFEGRLRKNAVKDEQVLDSLMYAWVREELSRDERTSNGDQLRCKNDIRNAGDSRA